MNADPDGRPGDLGDDVPTNATPDVALGAAELPSTPEISSASADDRRKRRRLLALLGLLMVLVVMVAGVATYYVTTRKPLPLPDIIQPVSLPHFMTAIYGVDAPIGIAVTPDASRVYVTEAAGDHLLRVFDGGGAPIASGNPPNSTAASRVPVYVARDPQTGEVYVSDRLVGEIDVYDANGAYLRKYPAPVGAEGWQPLGVGFDAAGNLWVTDVSGDHHRIVVMDRTGQIVRTFDNGGSLSYPNAVAVVAGTAYITDSNNGQLVRETDAGDATIVIGEGAEPGDLGLPRGIAADDRNRLYIADLSGQAVNVYQVTASATARPLYLGTLGAVGRADGQFEFPNGVAVDARGHIYVADRDNNRIQVWGY